MGNVNKRNTVKQEILEMHRERAGMDIQQKWKIIYARSFERTK
jgi:hypothetical protein